MSHLSKCIFLVLVIVACGVTGAHAQTTASIGGVVRDTSGGVVPGATVVVKEEQTGTSFQAVSDANGGYQVPALQAGILHRDRVAHGLQDRGGEGHPGRPRPAGDAAISRSRSAT